jgi:nitric oxide synthase oxygenase domain/subunit
LGDVLTGRSYSIDIIFLEQLIITVDNTKRYFELNVEETFEKPLHDRKYEQLSEVLFLWYFITAIYYLKETKA